LSPAVNWLWSAVSCASAHLVVERGELGEEGRDAALQQQDAVLRDGDLRVKLGELTDECVQLPVQRQVPASTGSLGPDLGPPARGAPDA
jgi:hypothetical protein